MQVTNKVPIFEVSSLDPGVPIKLYLYAENAKGTSDPAIIDDSTQNQQKHYVEGDQQNSMCTRAGNWKQRLLIAEDNAFMEKAPKRFKNFA